MFLISNLIVFCSENMSYIRDQQTNLVTLSPRMVFFCLFCFFKEKKKSKDYTAETACGLPNLSIYSLSAKFVDPWSIWYLFFEICWDLLYGLVYIDHLKLLQVLKRIYIFIYVRLNLLISRLKFPIFCWIFVDLTYQ